MEFLQLEYFIDAAKTENFSHTAKKYRVPTSNISQTVKRLESELGVKLFDRTANRISLSEDGKIFYDGVVKGLEEINNAKERILARDGEVGGEITLLIETNRRLVTKAIEGFRLILPSVSIIISHTYDENVRYDMIVSDVLPAKGEYEARHLVSEPMRLAVLRDTVTHEKKLADYRDKRFVSMGKSSRLYKFVLDICLKCGFTPDIAIQTDDPYYVRKYVEMGLGVAVVPDVSWRGLFSEKVELVDIGDFSRSTYLYLPISAKRNSASDKLAEMICDIFAKECNKST
jgi:DNA-binding transcriptional LysR family regulator